jgi:hypothetical protein
MQLKPGNFCPLIGEDCKGIQCSWFVQMRGMNPNTGEEIDEWNCAVTWLPTLLIENAQQSRQAGAAIESFRNEVAKTNAGALTLAAALAQGPQIMSITGT